MTNARLQLVFLGQLIEGETDARRAPGEIVGAPIATEHQEDLMLWHDLDADQVRRLGSRMQEPDHQAAAARCEGEQHVAEATIVDAPDTDAREADQATAPAAWTPFPVLEDITDEPVLRPTAPAAVPRVRAKPSAPRTTTRATGGSADKREVRCPNCGAYQSMRVLCRGCASFLQVALKAKAERDSQARANERKGLFAMLGL